MLKQIGSFFVVLFFAHAALATPVLSGDITYISAPDDAAHGSLQSGPASQGAYPEFTVFFWEERQNVHLPHDVRVNVNLPGVYDDVSDLPGFDSLPFLPKGKLVSSYMLHFDPAIDPIVSGSVTFESTMMIVGVIAKKGINGDDKLYSLTDGILGAAQTSYASFPNGRQLEFGSGDSFSLSDDMLTLSFQFKSNGAGFDEIRIITMPVPVPEPGSGILFAAGLSVVAFRLVRRRG